MYIYELADWPKFFWDGKSIEPMLVELRYLQGRLIGRMESIGFHLQEENFLQTLTQDVIKSSEIEGEMLDRSLVRSSVARRLGIDIGGLEKKDRNIEGVVEMVLDATQKYDSALTEERLLYWHRSLFPEGGHGFSKIKVGAFRTGTVQVISGSLGKEKVHFEAPEANLVGREMDQFLNWMNREDGVDLLLKSGVAHLWFVTIHPFDDGNGRIGRAIADMLLARSEKSSRRFYSLSAQIQKERKEYYAILEKTQKGTLDITPWLVWFLGCLSRSIESALSMFNLVLVKARFWESLEGIPLNERQRKMINLLLDGFEGKLTTSKWAKICKCSQDTAYRDIIYLLEKKVLFKGSDGGRSTNYVLQSDLGIVKK